MCNIYSTAGVSWENSYKRGFTLQLLNVTVLYNKLESYSLNLILKLHGSQIGLKKSIFKRIRDNFSSGLEGSQVSYSTCSIN